jgi:endonuclease/exonuclease/phosphatase family metal-dependent hydrolase
MTYNIRHARGADGRVDVGRIADVIGAFGPDVVGLQEVDVKRARSGGLDQAGEIARRLGMTASFQPCVVRDGEQYGIATLTRCAVEQTRHVVLPGRERSEPRCALVTRLAVHGGVDLINTHLSTAFRERGPQSEAIACELGGDKTIVIGDFNCTPWSRAYKKLCCGLRSATRFARTWPARMPVVPIDHILVRGLDVVRAGTWTAKPARVASDHLPVYAELAA